VRRLLRYPGEVFKFEGDFGAMVDVRREHINAYITDVMGERFSSKDFRTWAGTLLCACALARDASGKPRSRVEAKRHVAAAVREVAEHLGNTPAVCRASYVLPAVIRRYEKGSVLDDHIEGVDALVDGSPRALARCERCLLDLLGVTGATAVTKSPRHQPSTRPRPLRLEDPREPVRPADHPEPRSAAISH
jgi:DNA topoisomerase-1